MIAETPQVATPLQNDWVDQHFKPLLHVGGNDSVPPVVEDTTGYQPRRVVKKQFVYVPFVKEGYHMFPEAATDPKYATGDHMDVSHLGLRHFHYFHFKVWVEVTHANRDIEFIQLRRWLESLYDTGALELNAKSCEMLSDDLHKVIFAKYPVAIRIDVAEDGINGSYTEYDPV